MQARLRPQREVPGVNRRPLHPNLPQHHRLEGACQRSRSKTEEDDIRSHEGETELPDQVYQVRDSFSEVMNFEVKTEVCDVQSMHVIHFLVC